MSDKSLAVSRNDSLLPAAQDWNTMMTMAAEFVKSGLLPDAIKTPQAAVVIIQKGRELGLPPMAALSGISVIKGKPVASAELMLSLIYRDHGDDAIHIMQTDAKACRVRFKRRNWPGFQEFSFTIEDAATAGLQKNAVWSQYPAAMLRARCISAVARMAFPDSIAGMYTPEELGGEAQVSVEDAAVEWRETPQATVTETVDVETGEISAGAATLSDRAILKLEKLATEAGVSFDTMKDDAQERYGKPDYIHLSMDEAKDYAEWLKALIAEQEEVATEQRELIDV